MVKIKSCIQLLFAKKIKECLKEFYLFFIISINLFL